MRQSTNEPKLPYDQLWAAVGRLNAQQTGLETSVAALAKSHEHLSQSVDNGFSELRGLLEDKTRARPTNWVGISSLIVGTATTMAALGLFAIQPIADVTRENRENIKEVTAWQLAHVQFTGRTTAESEHAASGVVQLQDQMQSVRERLAFIEAEIKTKATP